MASSWRVIRRQGAHGRCFTLRHPLSLDRHARLPPSRTCDRVLRFAPEPVYAGVTGCLASRSTTFSSDRPATGRVVFLVCGVLGWRLAPSPYNPHLRGVGM